MNREVSTMKFNTQNAKIEAITEKTLVLGIDVLLFRDQLDLREPMVQTDNSQSHRFSLSKYRGADAAVKKNTQCCGNKNRNRILGKLSLKQRSRGYPRKIDHNK